MLEDIFDSVVTVSSLELLCPWKRNERDGFVEDDEMIVDLL